MATQPVSLKPHTPPPNKPAACADAPPSSQQDHWSPLAEATGLRRKVQLDRDSIEISLNRLGAHQPLEGFLQGGHLCPTQAMGHHVQQQALEAGHAREVPQPLHQLPGGRPLHAQPGLMGEDRWFGTEGSGFTGRGLGDSCSWTEGFVHAAWGFRCGMWCSAMHVMARALVQGCQEAY